MNLIIPSEGLMFWTALVFIILLVLLKKFAWKPILGAVHTRENNIQKALDSALEAESRMQSLVSENEKLLAAARDERDIILKEAKAAKEEIVGGAKEQANAEASKILAEARQQISIEKNKAITEIKNQIAGLSIEIAERILKSELSEQSKQDALVSNVVKDVNLN
jgi:F-type H+-transporting ATPase subunit b